MNEKLLSSFDKDINNIKNVLEILVSQRDLANAKADIAEKTLIDFKNKSQEELKNAYAQGYRKGRETLTTDVQGGQTKENNPKLVYTSNN